MVNSAEPRSDAAFCSILSGSTLFAKVYLSQYLGLLLFSICFHREIRIFGYHSYLELFIVMLSLL